VLVRLPDIHRSSVVLIAGRGADTEQLQTVRDALTDPVFGAFAADRCLLVQANQPAHEALVAFDMRAGSASGELLVYFAGRLSVDRPMRPESVRSALLGLSRGMFYRSFATNCFLIIDCTDTDSADTGAIRRELEAAAEPAYLLASVTAGSSSTFGGVVLRCLRDGIPGGPELISLDALAEQCRMVVREPLIQAGSGGDLAVVRNRALASTGTKWSVAVVEFYHNASHATKSLLTRASLLEPSDPLEASLLLPEFTAEEIAAARSDLANSSFMTGDGTGGLQFADPVARATAANWVGFEPAETIAKIQFALRQQRMIRDGIAPRSHLTRDYWTLDDQLEYRPFAHAIASFIRHPDSRPPLTIGVKGPWGAGKTSLMRMIRAELDDERAIELSGRSRAILTRLRHTNADTPVTNGEILRRAARPATGSENLAVTPPQSDWRATVWFNPWMHQNTEQVWAGLAHAIISQVTERLRLGDRERFWLELNLARLDRLAVRRRAYWLLLEKLLPILVAFLLAVGAAAVQRVTGLAADLARWMLAGGAGMVTIGALVQYIVFRGQQATAGFSQLLSGPVAGAATTGTRGLFDAVVPDPGYSNKTGFLHIVHHDMTRVLRMIATEDRPLVVFVDDLDRCSPKVVAEVIEAINLFLAGEFENCVFVVAMEPEVVAAHIEVAYADLAAKLGKGNGELGWRFLEKIVHLPMSLPVIDHQQHVPRYLHALLGSGPVSILTPHQPEAATPEADSAGLSQPAPPAHPLLHNFGPIIGTRMLPGVPGPIPWPLSESEIITWATSRIRALKPTLDTLPDIIQLVTDEAPAHFQIHPPPWPNAILQLALRAAEPVFRDLYTNDTAFDAIDAALPSLQSSNPREIKRYVNLFRFYSFITFHRRVIDSAPDNSQLAKLAALAIRWPDLLSKLSGDHAAVLDRLEKAAKGDDRVEWDRLLVELEWPTTRRLAHLREFLAQGPRIGQVAHTVL
jgi:KAP family P-loop domain